MATLPASGKALIGAAFPVNSGAYLTVYRYRNVTSCWRVMAALGVNVVALVPEVTSLQYAQATAL